MKGDRQSFAARSRARRRALQGLYQWHVNPRDPDDIVRQFLETQDFGNVDQTYFRRLLTGTVNHEGELIDALAPVLDRPVGQLALMERVVLLLGAYELQHCPDIPWRVVIDESVDLARRFGSEQGHAFVNGVLDALVSRLGVRDRDDG